MKKVILGFALVVGLAIWLYNFEIHEKPKAIFWTTSIINNAVFDVQDYIKKCNRIPTQLNDIYNSPCEDFEPVLKGIQLEDGWGRKLEFLVDGKVITIRSLGADGVLGGEGENKDIGKSISVP